MKIFAAIVSLLLTGFGPNAYATNETHQLKATVMEVTQLSQFSGRVLATEYLDPRFVITLRIESAIPPLEGYTNGSLMSFAVHSPARLGLINTSKKQQYDFELSRQTGEGGAKPSPWSLSIAAKPAGSAANTNAWAKGDGDMGPSILRHAVARGARTVNTNNLPVIGGEWRYHEDQFGVIFHLPRERFDAVQSFLHHVFGPPAQEPSATTDGGKLGWYSAKDLGVALQFGHDKTNTQVIVLRPQPASEIIRRIPKALEGSK